MALRGKVRQETALVIGDVEEKGAGASHSPASQSDSCAQHLPLRRRCGESLSLGSP